MHENILICIENLEEAKILKKTIESMGRCAEVTSRAIECVQKISNKKYLCVILDAELRGMGVHAIVSVIRRIDPLIPIIVTSIDAGAERLIIQGVDPSYCINKPIDPKDLEKTIAKIASF